MADGVTLRECPRCGCKHEPYEVRDAKGHYMLVCLAAGCGRRTGRYHSLGGAIHGWNTEEPKPDSALAAKDARIAGLEVELEDVRDRLDAVKKSLLQRGEVLGAQRERIAELEAALAAIKAQTCATCRHWVPGHKGLGTCEYHGYSKNIVTDTGHRCDYHVIKEDS